MAGEGENEGRSGDSKTIDYILPTRDWKRGQFSPHRADNPRPKVGVISKRSKSVPISLEPSFVAQENRYRHARQDYDHIGWSINFCMQNNFDARFMTILCKMITKLLSHFFHRYCFFTGPLTHYVQTLDMKRHPDFLRTFNSFLFHTLSSACLV